MEKTDTAHDRMIKANKTTKYWLGIKKKNRLQGNLQLNSLNAGNKDLYIAHAV